MIDTLVIATPPPDRSERPSLQRRTPAPEPLPDAVQWSEGMLLSPQHLQQADAYWQQQMRYRLAQITPCYWGVSALELDMAQLPGGVLSVQRLECVMPDGTPVVYPGSYTEGLELDISDQLQRGGPALRIALLMPRRLGGGSEDGSLPRHDVVEGALTADENSGSANSGTAVPVDRLRPRIMLFAGGAVPTQFQACPLMELHHPAEAHHAHFGAYHPPLLHWSAADFLGPHSLRRRVRAVNEALWLKLRELGRDRRDDGPDDDLALDSDARRQLQMARQLAAVLPRLGLLAARAEAPPLAVYDVLAEVMGAMAGFGANPIVPMPAAYRHDDCEPQFARALAYIERKLALVSSQQQWLAFEQTDSGCFERTLPTTSSDEWVIELRSAHTAPLGEAERRWLAQWLGQACIAAQGQQGLAQRMRVSAPVRMLSAAECRQRQLDASAALFVVGNEWLDVPGHGRQALWQGGDRLVIDGGGITLDRSGQAGAPDSLVPAAVLLVLPRGGAGPARIPALGSAAGVAPGMAPGSVHSHGFDH